MKSVLTLSTSLFTGPLLSSVAHTNGHKVLSMIVMPRNTTNDLTLGTPVCRTVERIQLTVDRGDVKLNGASIYFKVVCTSS